MVGALLLVPIFAEADEGRMGFCVEGDFVDCGSAGVGALARLSLGASSGMMADLVHLAHGSGTPEKVAGYTRMLARRMAAQGLRGQALEALSTGVWAVFTTPGSQWPSKAILMGAVAKQAAALGHPDPAALLDPGEIDWPRTMTAFQRMAFLRNLGNAMLAMDAVDRGRGLLLRAHQEVQAAPLRLADSYGDRASSLADLRRSAVYYGLTDLADAWKVEIAGLLASGDSKRAIWPRSMAEVEERDREDASRAARVRAESGD